MECFHLCRIELIKKILSIFFIPQEYILSIVTCVKLNTTLRSIFGIDLETEDTPFEVVNPTIAEVQEEAAYTAAKDAPIVAAARSAGTDYLVSLDRKHLVYAAGLSEKCGVKIVLPQELLAILRGISSGT